MILANKKHPQELRTSAAMALGDAGTLSAVRPLIEALRYKRPYLIPGHAIELDEETFVHHEALRAMCRVCERIGDRKAISREMGLTEQDLEILDLLNQENSPDEIGEIVGLDDLPLWDILGGIKQKLAVSYVPDALDRARRFCLVS
jgi:HEAT repeat protein